MANTKRTLSWVAKPHRKKQHKAEPKQATKRMGRVEQVSLRCPSISRPGTEAALAEL